MAAVATPVFGAKRSIFREVCGYCGGMGHSEDRCPKKRWEERAKAKA
eukprot:CAMPEP_0198488312 /NCGR_PEP_ID=MMETSP1462-20131121/680_1 /TAXON_ID=1333877 /ORGANISM="Brandtodinium nutriculum, Strain RCC3387" /LENGTH=46 /DNA_ID= /DNA_START= /DNA_END= /DNA_ORIENTATION=